MLSSLAAATHGLVVGPTPDGAMAFGQSRAASLNRQFRTSELQMAFPRVVVTGMGIVSPLGATLEDVNEALRTCNPGITECEEFKEVGMKSHVSGQPTFDWCALAAAPVLCPAALAVPPHSGPRSPPQ